MSKMKKGGLIGLIGGFGYNLIKQAIRRHDDPNYRFNTSELIGDAAKAGLVGAAAGKAVEFMRKKEGEMSRDDPNRLSRTTYLKYVLKTHAVSNFQSDHLYVKKGRELKGLLVEKFGERSYPPETSGSMRFGTGVGEMGDMDIILPFRKGTFNSTREMYKEVYDFLCGLLKEDDQVMTIRQQRRSIGMGVELEEDQLWFDIVPGLEVGNYRVDGDLYLHVSAMYPEESPEMIITNIKAQGAVQMGDADLRKIVQLLKIWRNAHKVKVSSVVLTGLTEVALYQLEEDAVVSLFDKLMEVLEFIGEHIEEIKLSDPGNRENIITESMTIQDRRSLGKIVRDTYDEILENHHNLKLYFPARK